MFHSQIVCPKIEHLSNIDKIYDKAWKTGSHWTYLLQILSKLWFQRVSLSENYEIVAIITDKNTFLIVLIIKLTFDSLPEVQGVSKDAQGFTKHASWGLLR